MNPTTDPTATPAPHGLRIMQSVKVATDGHPLEGQAGSIRLVPDDQSQVGVIFDLNPDREDVTMVAVADLEKLGNP